MNQVDRRHCAQLRVEELALLYTCGSEIRKTDHEAVALARTRHVSNTTSPARFFKRGIFRVIQSIAMRSWNLIKADVAHARRRPGL